MSKKRRTGITYKKMSAGIVREPLPELAEGKEELLTLVPYKSKGEAAYKVSSSRLNAFVLVGLRVLVDIIAYLGAIWFSYYMRYSFSVTLGFVPTENAPAFKSAFLLMLLCMPVFLLYMKAFGMYDVRRYIGILDSIPRIFVTANSFIMTLLLVVFLLKLYYVSRGFMVFFWVFIIFFTFLCRTMLKIALNIRGNHYVLERNALIVGAGKVGKLVALKMRHHQHFGMNPVGFVDNDPLYEKFEEEELDGLKLLGGCDDIYETIKKYEVDEVIIAFTGDSHGDLLDLTVQCNRAGIECSVVPRLFEAITDEITVNEIGGIPLLRLPKVEIKGINHILKTVEDYVLTSLIVLLLSPVILITAIAIRLDSKGPVIFSHTRVGKDGKPFKFYKFRSMVENADDLKEEVAKANGCDWLEFKPKDDPRITRVGRFIRKYSIDELPQFFCVFTGDMSLIGPRPAVPAEAAEYKEWYKLRMNVKPGITGQWQVSGRSDIPYDERIKLDLYYIENWSLWQDIKILIKTVLVVLSGKGAY
ncbi:MAG: sugar transferase [Actinobacteria bacterium]|nr:sugar transferase [Actinomycetota bacterium]